MNDQIAGLPVTLGREINGTYGSVTFQTFYVQDSPFIVRLDPPVATVEEVRAAALPKLAEAILAGGVFRPF